MTTAEIFMSAQASLSVGGHGLPFPVLTVVVCSCLVPAWVPLDVVRCSRFWGAAGPGVMKEVGNVQPSIKLAWVPWSTAPLGAILKQLFRLKSTSVICRTLTWPLRGLVIQWVQVTCALWGWFNAARPSQAVSTAEMSQCSCLPWKWAQDPRTDLPCTEVCPCMCGSLENGCLFTGEAL